MSNVTRVMDLMKAEPNLSKGDLVAKIVEMLGVSKGNAQVYVYNAKKKLDSGVAPKAVKAKEVVREKNDADLARIKEERLELMKKVSRKQKHERAEQEQIEAEMAAFSAEGDEYVQKLSPEFLRRELGIE